MPADRDDGVSALPHAEDHRVGALGDHGIAVGVGHGELGPRHRHAERGIRSSVDDSQPNPLSCRIILDLRVLGGSAVDEKVRIGDVAAVGTERRRRADHRPTRRHRRHAALLEVRLDCIRGGASAVDPVVQHHDQFIVVVAAVGGVLDDQRAVHAAIKLGTDVRMDVVGACVGHGEVIGERPAGGYRGLSQHGYAVHPVRDGEAVPVHRRLLRQIVFHVRTQRLPLL